MLFPTTALIDDPARTIRHAIRRLRWFKPSFHAQTSAVTAATGISYRISDPQLTAAFIGWLAAFDTERPERIAAPDHSPDDIGARRAFVARASGLMLTELIRTAPLSVAHRSADDGSPAHYWPEGYAYVAYCLNVRAAVLAQDFGDSVTLSQEVGDVALWGDFRTAVTGDPSTAPYYLDLFCGMVS